MAETQHDADIINAERKRAADDMQKRLERMGVLCDRKTYTGDSSYPVEYTLTYTPVSPAIPVINAVGPTFDLALAELIEKLLKALEEH